MKLDYLSFLLHVLARKPEKTHIYAEKFYLISKTVLKRRKKIGTLKIDGKLTRCWL